MYVIYHRLLNFLLEESVHKNHEVGEGKSSSHTLTLQTELRERLSHM